MHVGYGYSVCTICVLRNASVYACALCMYVEYASMYARMFMKCHACLFYVCAMCGLCAMYDVCVMLSV